MKQKLVKCSICNSALSIEETCYIEGEPLCTECYEEYGVKCNCCGTNVWRAHAFCDGYISICWLCRTNFYKRCTHCGIFVDAEDSCNFDGDTYCPNCYRAAADESFD